MTAFTTSMLPTGARAISTVEELSVWASQILLSVNPTGKRVLESGRASVNVAQSNTNVDADNVSIRVNYIILPIKTAAFGSSLPDWKKVDDLDSAPIPNSFQG